jgi:hypothetical protein
VGRCRGREARASRAAGELNPVTVCKRPIERTKTNAPAHPNRDTLRRHHACHHWRLWPLPLGIAIGCSDASLHPRTADGIKLGVASARRIPKVGICTLQLASRGVVGVLYCTVLDARSRFLCLPVCSDRHVSHTRAFLEGFSVSSLMSSMPNSAMPIPPDSVLMCSPNLLPELTCVDGSSKHKDQGACKPR